MELQSVEPIHPKRMQMPFNMSFRFGLRFVFWSAVIYTSLSLATTLFGLIFQDSLFIDILAQLKIWLPLICAFWIADLVICAYFLLNPQLVKQYRRMRSLREIASQN